LKISSLIVILLLSLFLYTWKIGDIVFVDEDEAIYADIASEMIENGDYLTPHYNFEVFHDKQPLIYWFIALSFLIFGKNEFAVRFWHSLMATGEIYIIYLMGKELFNRNTALLSSLITSTFFFYFYQARSPLMDIPLTLFITLSLYFFIKFFKTKNLCYHYLSCFTAGLAVMTKGLVGIVLPCLIISVFIITVRKKNILTDLRKYFLHIILGFIVFIIVAAPWHIIEYYLYGDIFIKKVFMNLTFGRYLRGVGETSPSYPFFTHLITILYGSLPWSGLIPCSLLLILREKNKWEIKFILIWLLVVFLFFSISAPKRIRYILPLFPALGIMLGYLWHYYLDSTENFIRKYITISAVLSLPLGGLIAGAILYARMNFPEEFTRVSFFCLPPLIILSTGIIISAVILLFQKKKQALLCFILTGLIFCISFIYFTSGYFNEIRPIKIFAGIIKEHIKEEDKIGCFKSFYPSLIFYTNHRVEELFNREELKEFLNSSERVFSMAEEKDLDLKDFEQFHGKPVFIIKEQAGYVLFSNKTNP